MVNIVEIAPPSGGRMIEVLPGKQVEIFGITGRMWAALARRFPELKRKIAGLEVPADDLAIAGMESGPAIIAAGLGQLGDAETEDTVDRLPPAAQSLLMAAIMEVSFPPANPPKAAAETQTSGSATAASTTSP